jgi:Predicted transcription factor, homolog of eukaryotic MBF1
MSFSNNRLGMFIRNGRLDLKLTQEQLAEKLNCNLSYLGNIERGKNTPSLKMFCKIVQTLNLSADDFIYPGHRSGSDSCLQLVQLLSQCTPREQLILLENARTLLENREEKLKK